MKRGKGFSASKAQRAKVDGETCRRCGAPFVDPAHVVDRSLGGCDDEDCVCPLCRRCHRLYDEGRIDILPLLSLKEQAHAVAHIGIERARWRTTNERAAA